MKNKTIKTSMVLFTLTLLLGMSLIPITSSSQTERPHELELYIQNTADEAIAISALVPAIDSSIVTQNNQKYAILQLGEEGFSNVDGQAQLPKIRRMIEIPQGATPEITINDITWEQTSLQSMNLPDQILPKQPSIQKTGEIPDFAYDAAYYNTNQFLPNEPVKVLEIKEIRGRRLAFIEISPILYNPYNGNIKLMVSCDLTMNLPGSDIEKTINNIERYSTEAHDTLIKDLFPNYGYYENYAQPNRDPEGYLIIVYDDFNDEITPLANWKASIGYDTTVTLTSNIPGGPTATNIKTYIEDAYDNWAIPPAYVLLVGDTGQIPTFTGSASGTATDTYFGTMDDDEFSDIFIGRFPGSNESQITAMVDKTIYYEDGDFDTDVWIKNATFMASTDNYQITEGTHNYVIDNHLLPAGYSVDKLYTVTYSATTQDVIDSLNAGASLAIYSGHGSTTSWADGPPFSQANVNSLQNQDMYPFVCSHACVTGTFTIDECFGETWVRAPNKGALAFWGSSHNTYWTEDDTIEKKTFDAWWYDGMTRIGQMTDKGLYDAYQFHGGGNMPIFVESYNILGDPSLVIWTEDPFTPEHDIKVADLNIPDVVAHGEEQTVSALVKNDGNNTETNIVVNFLEDGFEIDSVTIPSLLKGESTTVNFPWNPAIGTYLVAIESEPIVDEYDLLNNNVNKTVDVIAAPAIDVTPLSLTYMVPTDAQDTDIITITNLPTAEAALNYIISYDGDLGGSWLSANPETGTVAIDDSQIVTITVDTTGLTEGEYTGELTIASNDLDDPEVVVTVDLTVVYGNDFAAISVNSPVGPVSYGTYTVNATVQNLGFYDQTDVVVNCSIYEGYLDYEQDFETSDGDFISSGGLWEYGTPSAGPSGAHSGDYCWGTDLDANYGNDEDATLDSPEIMIPNGVTATLSFWQYYDTESYYDGGNVKISTDGGANWQLLGAYLDPYPEDGASSNNEGIPGEPCFSSSSSGWAETSFDLTAYGGETIMLRWHFGSDGSVTDPGWFIDDILITGEYGVARADNVLVFSTTETISLNAYESTDIEFSPDWVAGGGNYTIQITTTLAGDENPTNDIIADIVMIQGPTLTYDPSSIDFGTIMIDTTDSATFDIWNDGVGTLSYSISESESWLDVSPLSGDSTGEHDSITVDIDTTGMTPGVYHGDIAITSDGGTGTVGIDMYVVSSTTPLEDVVQEVNDRGFPIRHAADGDWAGAQDFLPTMNSIAKAEIYLRKFGTPEFDLVVELREGGIDGTLLDTVVFTPAEVPSTWTWFEVDFADTPVTSGVQYFIVCPPAPSGVTTSFGYEWGYAFGNQYDDGSFWFTRDSGNLWRDLPAMYEFTFKTYGLL